MQNFVNEIGKLTYDVLICPSELPLVTLPDKFPHCLIEVQWGFNRTSSITVFPISFNKTCIVTYDNGSSTAVRWLDNVYVKLNGIQMSTSGFIAVGI